MSLAEEQLPEDEDAARILAARAIELARVPALPPSDAMEVIAFVLGDRTLGVDARYVREVHAVGQLGFVPCVPAFVAGILNVRGQLISAIDLERFFGIPSRNGAQRRQAIVVANGGMEFAILADAVSGTCRVAPEAVLPAGPGSGIPQAYIVGLGPESLLLLDAARLLAEPAIVVDQE